jgi:putative phosphoserine phosphatase/1-acylglycerol-3-phosphate O-acyltransferase
VRVRVGNPVALKHASPDADTKRIMKALMELLPPESKVRREPTEAELALTYPPGYRGDPDQETTRRPGVD